MSTQHQDTRGRPDRSRETLPTGAALLPALQVLALMCLALFGWQLVEASAFTVSALTRVETAALCCVLAVVGLIGAAWVIRRRLGPGRGRAGARRRRGGSPHGPRPRWSGAQRSWRSWH